MHSTDTDRDKKKKKNGESYRKIDGWVSTYKYWIAKKNHALVDFLDWFGAAWFEEL